ncbi:MAG: FtsW/RodA/SpoVE family cell cycle protein [Clostridia bacterium]|nr:FtsW/RodA/SpoVE family cell cycle protein [Clostridia bacterium]
MSEILKWWKWIYLANIVLLLITLVFGYSPTGDENRSWINLGFTSIQPAEFSKVMFILTLSAHLNKLRERINTLPSLLSLLFHGGSVIGLVLAERDWGNALVFIVIFVTILFCAKIDLKYVIGCVVAGIIAFPIIWDNLGEFRKRRVLIGFNPELDPQGYGHQVIRSRNAIASGGLFGQGYLNGETIQRPGALFAQHTDMVFAVIGQEFGFVGCVVVIAIYVLLVTKIISISSKAGDYAGTYICSGVAGMFIFQFIINIGMALGVTPVVGITLPLISYGTSSLIAMYASLAFVMSVCANSNSYSYKSI